MRFVSHRLAPAFALSLLLAATAALHAETTEPAKAESAGLPAITVSQVVEMPLQDVVLGSGQIGPVEQVLVQPQIEGQAIDAIMVEIGDKVAQGQVLARLSDSSLMLQKSQLMASLAASDAAIAQAQAQVIEAQTASDEAIRLSTRTKALAAAGTSTKSAADTAQANATAAAARVTGAAGTGRGADCQYRSEPATHQCVCPGGRRSGGAQCHGRGDCQWWRRADVHPEPRRVAGTARRCR